MKEIGNLHGLEDIIYSDYKYEKDSKIYTLSSVKSKATFFNVNMPTMSIIPDQNIKVSFDWEYVEGNSNYISPYHVVFRGNLSDSSSTSFIIEFTVEVSKFKFTKSWEKSSDFDFYLPIGSIDNTYIVSKVSCLDKCPYESNLLIDIISSFLASNSQLMNQKFTENGVNAYYRSLPFNKLVQKVYTQTSVFVSRENNIDLCLEQMPEYDSSNLQFIFKRKGKLNDLEIGGDQSLTDTTAFQKFYLNKKLIQNIIKENLFNIVYEQANNPSSEYQLTVEYLKKIVSVSSEYEDSTQLTLYAEMKEVNFEETDGIKGKMTLKVTLIENEKFNVLFEFNCLFDFELVPTLLYNGLNFVLLSKNIGISSVESATPILDEELLNSWIVNSYLAALGKSEYNLFTLDFDLNEYINSDKLTYEFVENYLAIIKA